MARYIDAEDFAERMLKQWDTADEEKRIDIVAVIANIVTPILVGTPTADVVEVVHGEWVDDTGQLDSVKQYKCSNCGKKPIVNMNWVTILSNYCPDCGAKMHGKKVE